MPPMASPAGIAGMWGEQRVGHIEGHAVLWQGLNAGNLQPVGVSTSVAIAVREGQQAGRVFPVGQPERAVVWHGTAESMVYLHPSGNAYNSEARATDGTRQGGWVRFGTFGNLEPYHAALWEGTAESFVDLHPAGAFESYINDMAPGQQVGWTWTQATGRQAAVWSGTAASWQSFGVPGMGTSELHATTGTEQVGAVFPGLPKAAIWFNSAESYMDLHQFLPAGYYDSMATSIYREGDDITIGGWAHFTGGATHAVMWTGTIPAPGAGALALGAAAFYGARRRRRIRPLPAAR
jgi:hypothetical protein